MHFRIKGLSPNKFQHLYGQSDEALSRQGSIRYQVDEEASFPDRIEMRDGKIGETMLLLNFEHQTVDTPYQASHAIFVLEGATQQYDEINKIPPVMRHRLLSLRGFDETGFLLEADVVHGKAIENLIEPLFHNPEIAYIHVHNAKQGCYSGLIERA